MLIDKLGCIFNVNYIFSLKKQKWVNYVGNVITKILITLFVIKNKREKIGFEILTKLKKINWCM